MVNLSANSLAPDGARPSADQVLIAKWIMIQPPGFLWSYFEMFHKIFKYICHFESQQFMM